MSAHTDLILRIITEQGPLEQAKKAIERNIADLRAAGFRENKEEIIRVNGELILIIKRLSILHKAEVLATKKALEEISGGTYQITLEDVQEVGGTDELSELEGLLSGLAMSGGRSRKNKSRKTRKYRKSRN